jgi:hypothetical protein
MKSRTKKKLDPHNEPIAPNKAGQKKPYAPPRFEILTADQAKVRLTERALPEEATMERLLRAASERQTRGAGQQQSIPDVAKPHKNK